MKKVLIIHSDQFLTADYFAKKPPKSLDRDDFSDLSALVQDLSDSDAAATLTAMVAGSVACGLAHCPTPPERVLVTGGGRLNPVLMAELADRLIVLFYRSKLWVWMGTCLRRRRLHILQSG